MYIPQVIEKGYSQHKMIKYWEYHSKQYMGCLKGVEKVLLL